MSNIPEEHKIDDDTVDGYIEQLRKIVEKSQRLEYGPGGIMEMKQTIADKEDKLQQYYEFVWAFANEPMEMSWEKIPIQYRYWKTQAEKILKKLSDDHGR